MIDIGKLTGQQIGSYHLRELLGRGGFGAVYRAEVVVGNQILAKPVAVKVIDPASLDPKNPMRELDNAVNLEHPHLVKVLGHPGEASLTDADGSVGTVFWFAMELGTETLSQRLIRSRLNEDETLTLVMQVGSALAYLHDQQLVHRDVKPGNILKVGDAWKLGDLGLTRRTVDEAYTQLKGTTLYLSPESLDDPAPKPSWDIWALGMTALEAVGGGHPWKDLADRKVYALLGNDDPLPLPQLPTKVVPVIRGCLEKNPDKRTTSDQLIIEPKIDHDNTNRHTFAWHNNIINFAKIITAYSTLNLTSLFPSALLYVLVMAALAIFRLIGRRDNPAGNILHMLCSQYGIIITSLMLGFACVFVQSITAFIFQLANHRRLFALEFKAYKSAKELIETTVANNDHGAMFAIILSTVVFLTSHIFVVIPVYIYR